MSETTLYFEVKYCLVYAFWRVFMQALTFLIDVTINQSLLLTLHNTRLWPQVIGKGHSTVFFDHDLQFVEIRFNSL